MTSLCLKCGGMGKTLNGDSFNQITEYYNIPQIVKREQTLTCGEQFDSQYLVCNQFVDICFDGMQPSNNNLIKA